QDGKARQYHIIEVYATDNLNIVLSTGDLNAQGQGINQTNDITGLTDNDVYLTFTPGDESVSNGKIATYANITEEVTGNVKNDSVYAGYDIGTHSVYFENTIGWYNPKITVWNGGGNGAKTYFTSGGADNSQALTTVVMGNKPYYVWNYTGDETSKPTSVMFSSGSPAPQSVSIPFEDNSVYELSLTSKDASGQYDLERTTSADKWGLTADNSVPAKAFAATAKARTVLRRSEGAETTKKTLTVYFLNSVTINNVHAYAWYDHEYIGDDKTKTKVSWPNFGGAWPGVAMYLRPEKQGEYNIYSCTFTEDAHGLLPDKIIFNSGGTGYGDDKQHGFQSENIANPADGFIYELTTTGGAANNDGNMVYKQKGEASKYSKPYTVYFKNNGMTDPGIWWWGNGTDAASDLKGSATTNVDYSNRPSMTKITVKGYELYGYSFPSTMTSAPSNIKIEDKQGKGMTIDGAEFHDEYVYTDKATFVPLSEYKETSAEKTYTVYFRNKQNWSKVSIYTENPKLSGDWPGTEITTVDKNHDGIPLYKWSYTTDDPAFKLPTKLIFNNGTGGTPSTQSPDLTFVDNQVYVLTAKTDQSQWCDYKLDEVNSKPYSDYKESFKFTIYFHNSVGWNEPHLWVWNGANNFTGGDWSKKPAMTKTTLNGKSVWSWTYDPANLPTGYTAVNGLPTTVIFAAADQPQSAKLDYKEGGVYKLSVTDKTDADNTGSKHKLAEGSGQEDKEMQFLNRLYTRYIRDGVISTLCLPFNLTSAELLAMKLRVYDLSTADEVVDKTNSTTDGLLSFHRVRNVEAFHPYIFINNSGTSGRIFNSKIISRKEWQWPSPEKTLADLQKTVGDWTLQGNLVPDVVKTDSTGDGKTTYFGYAESTQSFIQMKKGKATVPASVCYFTLPTDKVKKAGYRFEGGKLTDPNAQTTGAKHFVVTLDDDSSTADVFVYGDGSSTTTGING
ncbi:MAG: starch-binding protein, partial [Prevotella sp.]